MQKINGRLNALGRELRKLRIDRGEIIKTMAENLGYSPSYLSAIEMGRREVPKDLVDKVVEIYDLEELEAKRLIKARNETINTVNIDLKNASALKRNLAFALASNINGLSDDKKMEIIKMLEEG